MLFEHLCCFSLNRLVAVRFRLGHLEGFAVQLETAHFLDRFECGLLAVKHDKSLALALEAALRDNVEYRSVVLEDFGESLLHGVDLDALFEIADLVLSASRYGVQRDCVLRAVVNLHKFYICD